MSSLRATNHTVASDEMVKSYTCAQLEALLLRERKRWIEMEWEMIRRGRYELTPEDEQIKYYLNWELAQCKSKTERALQVIALNHYENIQKYKFDSRIPVKLLSIVFSNNSLLEGKAWKSRTAAKFINGEIVVQRLASDAKIKGSKDFSKGTELLATFSTFAGKKDNKRQLGDILIMCSHPVRINDVIEVIDCQAGLISAHGVKFKYNIFFDECDEKKNLTNMVKFINTMYDKKLTYLIDEVQLITATPGRNRMLQRLKNITSDAERLFNIRNKLPIKRRVKDYRKITDQEYFPFEGPKDPTEYINHLYDKRPEILVAGKVYFIPAHHWCSRHEDMANLKVFQDKGYWVLILNGKHKEFRSPLGEIVNIMPELKKGGELRDILRLWRQNNPTAGLVITGKMVLERGLTFNTDGFNFDYMIISGYFAKHICTLVQLCGRGQGQIQFVGDFKVVMPQALYDNVKKYIEDSEKLIESDPEFYDQDMLTNLGKVDEFQDIEEPHCESTIEELAQWVNDNIYKSNGKPARIQLKRWLGKARTEDGFIMHKFGGTKDSPNPEKVWSEEEALKQRGGLAPYSRRVFPCYSDLNDITSLKWYVFYRNM